MKRSVIMPEIFKSKYFYCEKGPKTMILVWSFHIRVIDSAIFAIAREGLKVEFSL